MARTLLTPTVIGRTATVNPFTAAIADGHMWSNTGRQFLRVKNTDAAAKTLTFPFPVALTVDGQSITSKTVVVPATTGDLVIGPFPNQYVQDDNNVWVDYSAVTGVTVSVIEFNPVS